jgi:hypothetical protein
MKTILKLIALFLATNASAQWTYDPDGYANKMWSFS